MRLAAVAGEHAQQQRAPYVALGWLVGTAGVERTIPDPILEQAGGLEEFDEVGHLPASRQGGAAGRRLAGSRSLWLKLPG